MPEIPAPPRLGLPRDFLWGTATASYQIEGAVDEDGRGRSIWDTFAHTEGRTANGETGDVACDHYHRAADDVALMGELGLTAYRFSIAWPRVQPTGTGPANRAGVDFYSRLVDDLLEQDITPAPTLFHWDLPQALEDGGGWEARSTAEAFAEYAGILGEALGDRVPMWMTLNEAFVHSILGYGMGVHAPGKALGAGVFPVIHHLLLGHGLATQALRAAAPGPIQVGIAHNVGIGEPATDSEADVAAARAMETLHIDVFHDPIFRRRYPDLDAVFPGIDTSAVRDGDLDVIAQPLDFLGINYYLPSYTQAAPEGFPATFMPADPPQPGPRTEMGWPIVPEGLTEVLVALKQRYGDDLPTIHITESGVAYPDQPDADGYVHDLDRIAYVEAHLRAVEAAIDAGVDVRGYFVWSFMDNFEWAEGFRPRFGLVRVDYDSQRRTPKASALWFRDLIAAHRGG